MIYSDNEVRNAILSIIQGAAPLAIVYPWWALGANTMLWPGMLQSPNDGNRIHGYVFTRIETRSKETAMRCVEKTWVYSIWGFHHYSTGTSSSNTDLDFVAEIDAINDAFNDIGNLPAPLKRRNPLDWGLDLHIYGGELLHMGYTQLQMIAC
jgi:hypothetical protein